jgi:hypothetical protein
LIYATRDFYRRARRERRDNQNIFFLCALCVLCGKIEFRNENTFTPAEKRDS